MIMHGTEPYVIILRINNASCMFLPRIQMKKDVVNEESNAGKRIDKLSSKELPPCIAERATFMSPFTVEKQVSHPYAEFNEKYRHYQPTVLKNYPYSLNVVPYRWMLKNPETNESEIANQYELNYDIKKEPDLGFNNSWVQQKENQEELLNTFISAIEPKKSLIFIYAKNIPLVEGIDRVLIGVGRVTKTGNVQSYKYTVTNPPFQSVLWERPVFHEIQNGDGFLLPYQEILKLAEKNDTIIPEEFIAHAPTFEEFSFGSEHVSHDSAIEALMSLREALDKCGKILNKDYEREFEWIENQLSVLWKMRGAFPSIGPVLNAHGLTDANRIAWEIEEYISQKDGYTFITNPWHIVEDMFNEPSAILSEGLALKVGRMAKKAWQGLPPKKKRFMVLLSRIQLNNDQAKYFYELNTPKDRFLENPYLLYEESRLHHNPIPFKAIDRAMFASKDVMDAFPIQEPNDLTEPIDDRRVRALSINLLEHASVMGHSLLTDTQILTALNEYNVEPACKVTQDIMSIIEQTYDEGDDGIKVINDSKLNLKFYKLKRLVYVKEVIVDSVEGLLNSETHEVSVDWEGVLNNEFSDDDLTPTIQAVEEKARAEKVAALVELTASKFSVLIGSAGTGKTKLLNIFCGHPSIENKGVLRLAPTGKARVKLGANAKTVAQFLLEHERYDYDTGYCFPNPDGKKYAYAKTIIIDEASMLTEEQLAALLDTLMNVDRVILVGDHRQLPPIGTGRPFVDIIEYLKPDGFPEGQPRIAKGYAELVTIFRQKDVESQEQDSKRMDVKLSQWFSDSDIKKLDEDIFNQVDSGSVNTDNLKFVKWHSTSELHELLLKELANGLENVNSDSDERGFDLSLGGTESNEFIYFNPEAAKKIEEWQILSPIRGYGFGTKELNRFIQEKFKQRWVDLALNLEHKKRLIPKPQGIDGIVYGDKVINERNVRWDKPWNKVYPVNMKEESLKYIANGEIGIVTGVFAGNWKGERPIQITFSSQPDYSYQFSGKDFNEDSEISIELAYCITVHKSQGSGFKTVFLIVPNPCPLLSRELFYTALTRQENKVVVLHQGDFKDFKKFSTGEYSETARRLTDLFFIPDIRQVNKKYYDAKYVQISAKGEFMISKSEVIVADQLYYNKVDYVYENPIKDDRGIEIHPDFTIERNGKTYYWEHLGMLTKDDYRTKWVLKQEWYLHNGVISLNDAGENDNKILITTRDKADGGIDSENIRSIIENDLIKGESSKD